MRRVFKSACGLYLALPVIATAQKPARADSLPKGESLQVLDTEFVAAPIRNPAYRRGQGPVVTIDAAHHDFHTMNGRFRPFTKLIEADGYRVRSGTERIDRAALEQTRVLVIANALAARDEPVSAWRLPTSPAFDSSEVAAIVAWVRDGGSLLLIADHMPFPGAVTDLASALGIHFANGFALLGDVDPETGDYPIVFRRRDGTLLSHPITNGRNTRERVDSIETFTGSALHLGPAGGSGLIVLPSGTRLWLPQVAWKFTDSTAVMRGDGLLQGAALSVGRGRVAVFGEAALFTAQRKGVARVPMGFNAPSAIQNSQLIVNIMRWLTRVI